MTQVYDRADDNGDDDNGDDNDYSENNVEDDNYVENQRNKPSNDLKIIQNELSVRQKQSENSLIRGHGSTVIPPCENNLGIVVI